MKKLKRQFFNNRNILVTGATGGLGSNIVRHLAKQGANLVIVSRSQAKLENLIASLPPQVNIFPIVSDLSDSSVIKNLAKTAINHLGFIEVLFNVAGLGYFASIMEAKEEKMRQIFEINAFSPILLIKELIPFMKMRKSGRIINIVSSAGRVPIPTVGIYGSSKTALAVMTNTLRLEVSQHGIDILNIYPPTLDNSFEKNALKESDREGLCPTDQCGIKDEEVAQKIMEAATKPSGEIWLDKEGKWMSVGSLVWPGLIDRILENTAKRSEAWLAENKPKEFRKWKLLQVESSISCNLKCIMCPWTGIRQEQKERGNMTQEIWEAIAPFLRDVQSVDFTGGGEPLLQKNLFDWIFQAKLAGCDAGFLTNGLLLKEEKCEKIINCGQDWLGISIDGATREMYEKIRLGSNFERICKNISFLSGLRTDKRPLLMVNFVIMKENAHQMEEIIRLAREIGADQVNFKQCDVVRGDYGKGFGLFDSKETQDIKKLEKALNRARRLGRKLNINTTAFSFFPEEQPVCDQDPRNSLFIRYDGQVSPCINLAIGGPSTFLGKDVLIPNIFYGKLPEKNIRELWDTELCVSYRKKFDTRVKIYNQVLAKSDIGNTLSKLQEAFDAAIKAMPEPPKGCEICHYLYDI